MSEIIDTAISDVVASGIKSRNELVAALATAMRLELATLPPYLCAQWSIDVDPNHGDLAVGPIIESVAVQEMYHFALVGNILAALGQPPHFAYAGFTPTYPTNELPGGIPQDKAVDLAPLSTAQLEMFMQIENPQFPAIDIKPETVALVEAGLPATIGDFYDTIFAALDLPELHFDPNATSLKFGEATAIKNSGDAKNAVNLIKEEGEGFPNSPAEPPSDGSRLAHFYLFEMIAKGTPYVFKDGKWVVDTTRQIVMPTVHDFAPAPDPSQTLEFAKTWPSLLKFLEQRWQTGGDFSTDLMFGLEKEGKRLIKAGIRPDFRWVE